MTDRIARFWIAAVVGWVVMLILGVHQLDVRQDEQQEWIHLQQEQLDVLIQAAKENR